MLGFVFASTPPLSAKDLCRASCQCHIQARVIAGALPAEQSFLGAFRAIEVCVLAQLIFEPTAWQEAELEEAS